MSYNRSRVLAVLIIHSYGLDKGDGALDLSKSRHCELQCPNALNGEQVCNSSR